MPERKTWKKKCGEVLPFPYGFSSGQGSPLPRSPQNAMSAFCLSQRDTNDYQSFAIMRCSTSARFLLTLKFGRQAPVLSWHHEKKTENGDSLPKPLKRGTPRQYADLQSDIRATSAQLSWHQIKTRTGNVLVFIWWSWILQIRTQFFVYFV